MQAVPSLVGTGTAVAAAATGLVFAQPANEPDFQRPMSARPNLNAIDRSHSSSSFSATPPSASRPPASRPMAKSVSYVSAPSAAVAADDRVRNVSNGSSNTSSSFSTRPSQVAPSEASVAPSSTATLPRSTASSSQGGWNRRHSLIHRGDWNPPPISEVSRDSISSNGSWIRRLSIRPLSQHGSPRSSVGPDSLSLNFSLGSAAPILSQQSSSNPPQQQQQQQQSRNKLVKRATAGQDSAPIISLSRRGSRSQMPTLRRPATSHQRSATLHQVPFPDELAATAASNSNSSPNAADAKFSFDQRTRPSLAIFRLGAETPEPPVDQDDQADINGNGNGKQGEAASAHDEPLLPQQKEKRFLQTKWSSFFHGRVSRATAPFRGSSPFSSDSSPGGTHNSLPSRTLQVQRGKQSRTYLTHASALTAPEPAVAPSPPAAAAAAAAPRATATLASPFQSPIATKNIRKTAEANGDDMTASPNGSNSSPQDTPSKRARRSISMNFSSPTSWMSKTGSIRRPKREKEYPPNASATGSLRMNRQLAAAAAAGSPSNGKRHVSAPLAGSRPSSAQAHYQQFQTRSATTPADLHFRQPVEGAFQQREQAPASRSSPIPPSYVDARAFPKRQRNSSSPLPPLSRLSSFNIDLTRLGASSSASGQLASAVSGGSSSSYKENQAPVHSGSATLPRSFPLVSRNREVSDERSSTLASPDLELRGFASSGDDDDTDFKSDTIFDSIRTAASARVRSTDTPIESMFDESPPSTAGNGKSKRLSIQEILGQAWDSDTRIMEEEDEGFSTPIRTLPARAERSLSPASVMRHFDEDYEPANGRDNYPDTEANSVLASTNTDTDADADANFSHVNEVDYSRPSLEDDDDDDWARIDDSGVTNHLSPPSRSLHNSFHEMSGLFQNDNINDNAGYMSSHHQRPALGLISGNGGLDPSSEQYDSFVTGGRERPRSNLFDWSEATVHLDKIDSDGHSPRPKTVHGKQELDLRNGRPANRKGPAVAHVRSQSVPVNADPATENTKPSTSKFGTWASSGPKNASEDWDDDFDFGTNHGGDDDIDGDNLSGFDSEEEDAFGRSSTLRSSKGPGQFAMIVPASIQATQPTVKAHSGQIRELSLLVNGLKRLCRHARDLNIVDESPALWKEAENIIALASPDEDLSEAATSKGKSGADGAPGTPSKTATAAVASVENDSDIPRASIEFDTSDVEDRFLDAKSDGASRDSFDDPFDTSDFATQPPSTPPRLDMSRTGVVRERHNTRRRSVFSPEDDIFGGGWPLTDDNKSPARQAEKEVAVQRPQTPNRFTTTNETPDSAMIESIMAAMQQQRSASAPIRKSPVKQTSTSELFFNTNTLQELVKRANNLFHTLSDLVRRAELFTQSPAVTPRHDRLNRREDGSPAFTRVFTDPSSPSKRLPKSHSGNSVARASPALESPSTARVSQRLQMMTVN